MMRLGTAGEAVYREHPIKILRYSAKNLWLLIFPLLRSLRFYPFSLQKLIDWGAGAWFDLLVALLILGHRYASLACLHILFQIGRAHV